MPPPRILVAGTYHPTCAVEHMENAFRACGHVSYVGTPWNLERAGYARDVDIGAEAADVLFFVEEWFPFFPRGLERAPFPTAVHFADVIYDLPRRLAMAPFFDHVFVAHKDYVDRFQAVHPSVHWLPFGAPEEVFAPGNVARDLDVAFIGTPAGPRVRLLERLEREFKMNDFRRDYTFAELARTYERAKVVINQGQAGEITLRIFEATAAGAALVTEAGSPGLEELFAPGRDIVTYRNQDEAVGVVRALLADDDRRRAIAEAGHQTFLSRHTWRHRARTVLDTVQAHRAARAPARGWSESRQLVSRAAVYAGFPMVDELAALIASSNAPRLAKLRAMGYLLRACGRRARRLGWRRFIAAGSSRM